MSQKTGSVNPVSESRGSKSKIILTLDIGFEFLGWGIIEDGNAIGTGVIKYLSKKSKKKKRLHQMDEDCEVIRHQARSLKNLIRESRPIAITGELPHGGGMSARATRCMGIATAVALSVVETFGLPAQYVTPDEVKALTNRFKATKDHVREEVEKVWSNSHLDFKAMSSHETDALAAYLAARNYPLIRAIERGTFDE